MSGSKKQKTHCDVYLLQKDKLVCVNDSMIKQQIETVSEILSNVKKIIIVLEHFNLLNRSNESIDLMEEIYIQDDVIYKLVKMNRWRRGTGFLCLQISSNKESRIPESPMGCARICCFTTDKIHHNAFCFGKIPCADDAMFMIQDYVKSAQIIDDLNELKISHPTSLSAEILLKYIKY